MRAAKLAAAVGTALLLSGACTGSSEMEFRPTFGQTPCPEDVTRVVLTPVTCGFLTVLENRSEPDGDTIRLFVTRIQPPGGNPAPDPVLSSGSISARLPTMRDSLPAPSGSTASLSSSTRGTGHSEPTLACPEVQRLEGRLVGARLSDR